MEQVRPLLYGMHMETLRMWLYVIGTVGIAVLANTLSAHWAQGETRWSPWLLAIILISPFVFISFGLVTSKFGLSIASGVIDSLLTATSVFVGLVAFGEWNKLSGYQFFGLALALIGIFFMLYFQKAETTN